MQEFKAHQTSYGWNYFIQVAKTGAARIGRYFTNGHTNANKQTHLWLKMGVPPSTAKCIGLESAGERIPTDLLEASANELEARFHQPEYFLSK